MLTDSILDLIGNTPLLRLKGERILAKAEFLNPGGSIKDRIAVAMLNAARKDGKLRDDSIILWRASAAAAPSRALANS